MEKRAFEHIFNLIKELPVNDSVCIINKYFCYNFSKEDFLKICLSNDKKEINKILHDYKFKNPRINTTIKEYHGTEFKRVCEANGLLTRVGRGAYTTYFEIKPEMKDLTFEKYDDMRAKFVFDNNQRIKNENKRMIKFSSVDIVKLIEEYDEFIVEKVFKTSENRPVTKCVGKVFVPKTMFLNNQQLEEIWDLSNFNVSHPNEIPLITGTYKYCACYYRTYKMFFINILSDYSAGIMNDDIVIYKKNENNNVYYIKSFNRTKKDEWFYTSRNEAINYFNYFNKFLTKNKYD